MDASVFLQARARRESGDRGGIDPEITRRLSALPELYVLHWFRLVGYQASDRLAVLLQLTDVIVHRPADWDYTSVRRVHDEQSATSVRWLGRTACFACDDHQHRVYLHHVIEVQHGGSNTGRNLVSLCFRCHQYLHPWLTEEPPTRRPGGFEVVRSIAARVCGEIGVVS
jgi:hypothetical protein